MLVTSLFTQVVQTEGLGTGVIIFSCSMLSVWRHWIHTAEIVHNLSCFT